MEGTGVGRKARTLWRVCRRVFRESKRLSFLYGREVGVRGPETARKIFFSVGMFEEGIVVMVVVLMLEVTYAICGQ